MDERRGSERHHVWSPMTVITASGDEGTAITYDVSATGVLLASPGKLEVGARVTLRFRVDETDPEERSFAARVVRVEENPHEVGPWRYRMAVELDEPHPELDGMLEPPE